MPVDVTLTYYSDLSFDAAVAIYLFAMLLHALEYVSYRAPQKVTAGVGSAVHGAIGGGSDGDRAGGSDGDRAGGGVAVAQPRPPRPRHERLGRTGVALTVLAALLHAFSMGARGVATGRVPWGNMYEFIAGICLAAVVCWLIVLRRQAKADPNLHRLGVFLLAPVFILMFLGGTVLYADAGPLIPALQSFWIRIHVALIIPSSGMLLFAGVASALYLARRRSDATAKDATGVWSRLPSADVLDRLAYRTTVVAVVLFTAGVITGAIWAEAAWGRFWGWDPKETVSLVAWVFYAGYLHARATAGWRGVRAAWINVIGFAVMLFNLFFINIVIAGLHSYAGL